MKIAVDIDDTLNVVERAKYAGAYIARNGLPYRLADENSNMFVNVYDWDLDAVLKFIREGGVIAFTDAAAREGAREALGRLRKDGHEIIVLTSRQKEWFANPEKISRDWLEKRRIPYDSLVAETADKGLYCAENKIPVLVEDNPDICLEAQKRGVNVVLAVGKHNHMRADEIYFGGANWAAIEKAVRQIARIRFSEELAARACPARVTEAYDGWELRSDSWSARRGNHIRAVLPSKIALEEKLAYCEKKYALAGKPCRFRLTALDGALETELIKRGYVLEKTVRCMTLDRIPDLHTDRVRVVREANEWIGDYLAVNGPCAIRSYALIGGTCVFVTAYEDVPVAVGMGVVENGVVALYDIRVRPEYRGKGYGKAVTARILEEGKRLGAVGACLHAEADNEAALGLYGQFGFVKSYDYRYRVRT